jgi:hypothetical protein
MLSLSPLDMNPINLLIPLRSEGLSGQGVIKREKEKNLDEYHDN